MSKKVQQIKLQISKHASRINSLSYYARIGVCIGGCIIILILWQLFLNGPIRSDIKEQNTLIGLKKKQVNVLQDKIDVILDEAAARDAKYDRKRLAEDLKSLDKKLALYSDEFIPADKMDDVFKDLLAKEKGLTLTSMESLKSRKITSEAVSKAKVPVVVEQGLRLQFTGNYFSTLKYLQDLESLNWRIFWNKLDYHVTEYPEAEVTLEIHTLSTKAGKS